MYTHFNSVTGANILEVKMTGLCMWLGVLLAHLVCAYAETPKENKAFNER